MCVRLCCAGGSNPQLEIRNEYHSAFRNPKSKSKLSKPDPELRRFRALGYTGPFSGGRHQFITERSGKLFWNLRPPLHSGTLWVFRYPKLAGPDPRICASPFA